MLTPTNVFAEIERRRERSDDPIRFYWVDISTEGGGGDRNRFVRSLHDQAGSYPMRAVILRTPGFMDANSVMNDLAAVLEGCKRDLLSTEMRRRIGRRGYLDIALIARRELKLAITSSPLEFSILTVRPANLSNRLILSKTLGSMLAICCALFVLFARTCVAIR